MAPSPEFRIPERDAVLHGLCSLLHRLPMPSRSSFALSAPDIARQDPDQSLVAFIGMHGTSACRLKLLAWPGPPRRPILRITGRQRP